MPARVGRVRWTRAIGDWRFCPSKFPEIRPEILNALLAGGKVFPPNFTRFFSSEISIVTQNFQNTLLQAWQTQNKSPGLGACTIVDKIITYCFFRSGALFSVLITGNFTAWHSWGINYCNVMISAVLLWKERIFRLQLQFFSPSHVWISYCNITPCLYKMYLFRMQYVLILSPMAMPLLLSLCRWCCQSRMSSTKLATVSSSKEHSTCRESA